MIAYLVLQGYINDEGCLGKSETNMNHREELIFFLFKEGGWLRKVDMGRDMMFT